MAPIDGYIRDNVIKLNKMGMKTLWSCSGLDEDHKDKPRESPLVAAYLCVNLNSLSKRVLTSIAIKLNSDLSEVIPGTIFEHSLVPIWKANLTSLMDFKTDEYKHPVITFCLNVTEEFFVNEESSHGDKQIFLRKAWDKLFVLLFDILEKENKPFKGDYK